MPPTKRQNKYAALIGEAKKADNNHRRDHPMALRNRDNPDASLIVIDEEPKRGRPRTGHKRFSKDFQQVTAYVPKPLFRDVKIALIKNDGMQFTALVCQLLEEWVSKQPTDL